jgi:glycosyltransferase involved in cell wall biosynthesis
MSESPIRLLLLTDEMEVGGTQRQIVELACGLDARRFEVTVLFFRERSFLVDTLERAGVQVLQVERHGRFDLSFVPRLARTLARHRFQVMHCFAFSGEFWGSLARALLPRRQRPVLISSVRGTYEWYSRTEWMLKRWVTRQSALVISNSRVGGDYARDRLQLPPGAVDVVYNGVPERPVDAAQWQTLRAQLAPAADAVVALFVGRLVEHKNLPRLLKALKQARAQAPELVLWLAGSGPLLAQTQALAQRLGLDSPCVRFLGERKDTAALMAACDFVVLPSLREGLSNVLLEAMMGRRSVLSTVTGGTPELVVDGVTGLLVDPVDSGQLAQALLRLTRDRALRDRLGLAGEARAREHFSVPAMVKASALRYEAVLRPGFVQHKSPAAP